VLLADLAEMVSRDRASTAELLAYLSEVDGRRLFRPAGYPSMYAYCVGELHLSEQAAYKRIYAARVTRRFPAVFAALSEGRIHLAGVCLIAPYLKSGNVDELLAMATHQRKSEIERRLALRFPRTELMTIVEVYPGRASSSTAEVVPEGAGTLGAEAGTRPPTEPVDGSSQRSTDAPAANPSVAAAATAATAAAAVTSAAAAATAAPAGTVAPAATAMHATGPPLMAPVTRPKWIPLAPQRFGLQLSVPQSTYDKVQHALALLSHVIPCGDVAQVLDRALDLLIEKLERRKLGAALQPRAPRPLTGGTRYVPAHVRRAVWKRDQGRCTFVSESGHRCEERRFLQFDHIEPVARGGIASVDGIRLRCRAHNQLEAERVFGKKFMMEKRESRQRRSL